MTIANAVYREGIAISPDGAVYVTPAPNSGVPTIFSKSGIAFELAPTGTMGNNGAVTMGTAFPRTYSNGVWVKYPAGAVAAGVPAAAAWLWTVMSSTTVGTVYNSTYTVGTPTLGTTTAYVTTGPGAFTGVTGAQTAVSLTLPAGAMGANGQLLGHARFIPSNNAGAKVVNVNFGSTDLVGAVSIASTQSSQVDFYVANNGVVNSQEAGFSNPTGTGALDNATAIESFGTENTALAVTIAFVMNRTTATDIFGMQSYRLLLLSDGT